MDKQSLRAGAHRHSQLVSSRRLSTQLETDSTSEPWKPEVNAPKYSYEPFQDASHQIRLLLLPENAEGQPKCSGNEYQLRIFPWSSAPRFEAISYTWGPKPHDDSAIVVQEHQSKGDLHGHGLRSLPVSKKVRHILQSRNTPQRAGDQWVWMDSVCINQKDDAEKSLQVRQMGDIYQRASKVVICLDDPESPTPLRFRVVLKLLHDLLKYERVSTNDIRDVKLVGGPDSWHELSRFMSHAYWTRIWIIQEAALAKSLFIFGDGELLAWDEFLLLWYSISASSRDFAINAMWVLAGLPPSEAAKIALNTRQIDDLIEMRQSYENVGFPEGISPLSGLKGLRQLLIESQRSHCADPRDKIFGLLGLVRTSNKPEETIPEDLQPIYDVSAEVIYTRLARSFCSCGLYEPLFFLCGIGYLRKLRELPSWVTDWTSLPSVYPILTIFSAGGRNDRASMSVEWSGSSPARLHVPEAYRIGVLAESLPQKLVMDSNGSLAIQFVLEAAALVEKHFPDELDSLVLPESVSRRIPKNDTLWRTLLMDCDLGSRVYFSPAPSSYATDFAIFYNLAKEDPYFNVNGFTHPSDLSESRRFLNKLSFNSNQRTFGVTESFGMAIVPPLSRPGDEFYVIKGLRYPVLLRPIDSGPGQPQETKYRLVGDTYLHGMMRGEGLSLPSCKLELI